MKYHNKPCEIDGFKLDSQLELRAYQQIKAFAGDDSPYIVKRNIAIPLLPENGKFKAIIWRVDFALFHKDGNYPDVLIECKGVETPEFLLKMNLASRLSFWRKVIFVYETMPLEEASKMRKYGASTCCLFQLTNSIASMFKRLAKTSR